MKTIKINGIPYSSRESGIDRLVRKYNWTINEVYMPVDRHTGHSKGYAFVRFEHIDEAEEAFDRLEGKRFDGRKLSMEWARDSGGGGGRRNQRKSRSRSRSFGRRRVSRSRSRSGGRRRRSRTRD